MSCLVDNASDDGTVAIARAHIPWHGQVTAGRDNPGYATGNLRALDTMGPADAVLLLNPDCVLAPDTLERLAAHLDDHPHVAAAAALLCDPDGGVQFFVRREPTLRDAMWWFLATLESWDREHGATHKADREMHDTLRSRPSEPFPVDVPAAACVLLRAEALPEPVLDPAFRLFFNDVDLFRRLREASWTAEVVPSAVATHAHGASHRQLAADTKRAEQVHGLRVYTHTWWSRPRALLLDALLLLDAAGCLALSLRGNNRTRWRLRARGTLGGLGLPLGTPPFLSAGQRPRGLPRRPAPTPPS
jgi:GT2 family glycosyltransferase